MSTARFYNSAVWCLKATIILGSAPKIVLVKFKFGNLLCHGHTHACINYYWWILSLANFRKKLPNQTFAKVSHYMVYRGVIVFGSMCTCICVNTRESGYEGEPKNFCWSVLEDIGEIPSQVSLSMYIATWYVHSDIPIAIVWLSFAVKCAFCCILHSCWKFLLWVLPINSQFSFPFFLPYKNIIV